MKLKDSEKLLNYKNFIQPLMRKKENSHFLFNVIHHEQQKIKL